MENISITTPVGEIIGKAHDGYNTFLGIQYGDCIPFEKATQHKYLKPYEAFSYGDCCTQYRCFVNEAESKKPFYHNEFRAGANFTYSKECLNLNIFTPTKSKNCPVIMNIHGGSFTTGSSDENEFDGKNYALNNTIMVTINYRLNIFGFYADSNTSNLAISDIILAIDWVKNNISSFGGDCNNITLMGQSAGAMLIQPILLNPNENKKIKAAILLSGGGFTNGVYAPHSQKRAIKFSSLIRKELNVSSKEELKKLDNEVIFKAWQSVSKKHPIMTLFATMPVFDEVLIKKEYYHNVSKYTQTPVMISTLSNDLLPKKYVQNAAKKYAKVSASKVYNYVFTRTIPGHKSNFHSADLWYVFCSFEHCSRNFSDEDKKFGNDLLNILCEFALTHEIKEPNPINIKLL